MSSVSYFNPPEIVVWYSHVPLKITIMRYKFNKIIQRTCRILEVGRNKSREVFCAYVVLVLYNWGTVCPPIVQE